jgi:hypothetical protein
MNFRLIIDKLERELTEANKQPWAAQKEGA